MQELILKGGPLMWPLMLCSVISLTVILERVFFWLRQGRHQDRNLIDRIFDLTEQGAFDQVGIESEGSRCMTCRLLADGLAHRNYGLAQSLEAAAGAEIAKMKKGLSVLDTIITLAPLLGILGTVAGIITSFDLLGSMGIQDPKSVTGGIAQALLTTAAGLTVAIVTLVPYNALVHKVETLTHYMEKMCTCYEVTVRKGAEKQGAA